MYRFLLCLFLMTNMTVVFAFDCASYNGNAALYKTCIESQNLANQVQSNFANTLLQGIQQNQSVAPSQAVAPSVSTTTTRQPVVPRKTQLAPPAYSNPSRTQQKSVRIQYY